MSGKGMDFFKKFANKEGSMFKDMKLKTTKTVAQTQTNLNFTQKSTQNIKQVSKTKDDISIKRQQSQQDHKKPHQQKTQATSSAFKKNIKPSENIVSPKNVQSHNYNQELVEAEAKEVESPPVLSPVKEQVVSSNVKKTSSQSSSLEDNKPQKSSRFQKIEKVEEIVVEQKIVYEPKTSIAEKKKPNQKPQPPTSKKAQQSSTITRKASTTLQADKKKSEQQKDKPKKSQKQQILSQIYQSYLKISNTVIKQRQIQSTIIQNQQTIESLKQQISTFSSKQFLFAQRQQYQQADKLQSLIEQSQNKIDQLQIQLNFAQQQSLKKQSQELSLLKTQNNNIKRINRKLKLIELQLQDDANHFKKEETEQIEVLNNKKQIQKKKLVRIQKDITYQTQQISQYQKILNEELFSKMDPLKMQKDRLEDDKGQLEGEIKELQKKLKEKKNQLLQKTKKLKSVNENIAEVKQSFQQESDQLSQRKKKLQNIETQKSEIQHQIKTIETSISSKNKQMDHKVNSKIQEANEVASLAKHYEQKQFDFQDECQARRVVFQNYLHNSKELKVFQIKHKAEKQEYRELENKKNNINSEIVKLQEKRDHLKKKIPVLENQQKKFAEQKNYKAANLKKNEIKQLNDQVSKIKQKIQLCIIQEHQHTKKIQLLTQSQKEYKQQETQLYKNMAFSQYKFYICKQEKIKEYIEEIGRLFVSNVKEKEKIVRQLEEQGERLRLMAQKVNQRYRFQGVQGQEEEVISDGDGDGDDGNRDNEAQETPDCERQEQQVVEDEDNEKSSYKAPLIEQEQKIEQEEQNSGYVPLQLD